MTLHLTGRNDNDLERGASELGAESGAVESTASTHDDLRHIAALWPSLPNAVKDTIRMLVDATS